MAEPRKYRNPPIEEALCEIYFAPGPEWDPTMPGRIYPALKEVYHQTPGLKQIMEVRLEPGLEPGVEAQSPILTQRNLGYQFLFRGEEGRRIVKIGPNRLSIHMLRPYLGWEKFQPQIREALAAYQDVAGPNGITRIGLRYTNKIVIPGHGPDLSTYFTFPPRFPTTSGTTHLCSFLDRKEVEFPGEPIRLVITFADMAPADASSDSSFLLDLDIIRNQPGSPISLAEFPEVLEDLKLRHRRAFEELITEETRGLFDAE